MIDEIGSVDEGSTQTDSLALERQRGITIKSAVVSFQVPPGFHRRGGAGAWRARRRRPGDLGRRGCAGAKPGADAHSATAGHSHADLREQDRPCRCPVPASAAEHVAQAHTSLHSFRLELPADLLGTLLPALARLRAIPRTTTSAGTSYLVEGEIPAARVHALELQLPGLTGGEGVLETSFDHYEPVHAGRPPTRPRTDHDPLTRKEYLLHVQRRV